MSMKRKPILTRFGGTFGRLGFDENSFFSNTLLGFTPYWDYKPTNAIHSDYPGVYTGETIIKLSTIKNLHLKCEDKDGSVVGGIREPILYCFVLDKLAEYKVFCQPETVHQRK